MALQLTDAELIEMRNNVSLKATVADLPDDVLRSGTVLGEATDYVFEAVRANMQTSGDAFEMLSPEQRAAITAIQSRTTANVETQIANFINVVLVGPQKVQFRRAVIFRGAGLATAMLSQLLSESAGGIAQRFQNQQWEVKQAALFALADEQINHIRNAFPEDIFTDAPIDASRASYKMFDITGG